ncbi:bifunctional 2-polyprenyl-6-hydroxyphenol methylase/3-demethylubiquinol 3-O-methyltransferase UbiG [Sphingorhabdus sp.]|uniref:bifunctional 2-polyprenyl-6-hydroxyphenol methylase/3-demethylubiquinol 3-O-methyltransferase UbiG n=1 Tax=Sphingorhabdus sp. TaxID=1902408 RepID=UPI00359336E6
MTKASTATTINAAEAAHFGALAADWWDPKGSSAMLHKLNPVRLGFIRAAIDSHFEGDSKSRAPLTGKSALDVGCGAGLLCEPLARMGARMAGVDAAPENIEAAKAHAVLSGLNIDYRAGEIAAQGLGTFDVVTSMEVIEHVIDPSAFIIELARHLKPDGLLLLSTPNRTAASRLFLVEAAERLGQVPRGTHHWDQFLTPEELTALLDGAGLQVVEMQGIAFSPLKGLHLSRNMALNYILSARFA